ncbi:unnamed protein product [Aphanomyces euteiches]|nr:hypothetical protein AeRB84_007059 [Aphanomyces euteiches]
MQRVTHSCCHFVAPNVSVISQIDMTKLLRIVLLLALFLVHMTVAYLPEHLQLRREMVPFRHQNDKGQVVEEMVERVTAVDPDDKSPTAKKPARKQVFFAAIGALVRVVGTVVRAVKTGVKIAKGINHVRNAANNNNNKKKL